MKYIVVVLLFLVGLQSHAQQVISGLVTNYTSGELIDQVKVRNRNKQLTQYSNDKGQYSITVSEGDTIAFSRIGYFDYVFVVEGANNQIKNIELRKQVKLMKEAHVSGLTAYQKDSLERAVLYSKEMGFEKENSVMSPVSYVYQRFSKKYKNLEKFQASFEANEDQKYIDTKYTLALVEELTGLKGDDAANFKNKYPMEIDFARNASELEIKLWIKYNFKQEQAQPPK